MKTWKYVSTFCLVATCLFILTSCKRKESISIEEFKEKMEGIGYSVQDVTDLYDAETTSGAYIAMTPDLELSFYILNNEENAKSFYTITKRNNQEEMKKGRRTEKNIDSYDLHTLLSDKEYRIVSRVEKTVLVAQTNKKNKKELNSIMKKLGY